MNLRRQSYIYIMVIHLIFIPHAIAEELNLSDEQVAKQIFEGKSLNCWMDETNYHGPIVIETKEIKGKKFKGLSKEWCQQDLIWKGKFKGKRMKITQVGMSAHTCYCRTGFLDVSIQDDGSVEAVGKYKVGCGATPFHGELKCKVE